MSHAIGQIWRGAELIGLFEFNGTVMVCRPIIHQTQEEIDADWRGTDWKLCYCPAPPPRQEVTLWTCYGGGFYWKGAICPICQVITDGLIPYDIEEPKPIDGQPFPEKLSKELREWCKL